MATPTTTFTWAVSTMDRQLSNGAVQTVHWTLNAHDGTYGYGAYGSVALDQPEDDADLTAYADLTLEWAIAAVQAKLGEEEIAGIQAQLQTQIDVQRTPVAGSGVPWS